MKLSRSGRSSLSYRSAALSFLLTALVACVPGAINFAPPAPQPATAQATPPKAAKAQAPPARPPPPKPAKATAPPPATPRAAPPARPAAATSGYAYQIRDASEPNEKIYIKTNGQLAHVTSQGERLLGNKAASTHPDYQWKIRSTDGDEVFVDSQNQMWGYDANDEWVVLGSVVAITESKPQAANAVPALKANESSAIANPAGRWAPGYEVVQASVTTGAKGSVGEAFVVCPADKKVLDGGYWSNSGIESWRIWRSHAADAAGKQPGDRGWTLSFTSVERDQLVWVRAVCASI